MYSTCIFCNTSLGQNRSLERFPVGHRLAFDARRGRLWVVCSSCLRWNLSPLEERWEVIEDCERLYRGTRVRVSTEQIGLARLAEGLELVRIGRPLRPEFAAWRYGDQFAKRRQRAMLGAAAGLTGVGWLWLGGIAGGSLLGMYILYRLGVRAVRGSPNKIVAHVPVGDSRRLELQRKELARVSLEPLGETDWSLTLPATKDRQVRLYGEDALRGLALVLPPANRYGGNRVMVQQAVQHIEHTGDPLRYVQYVASRPTLAGSITEMPPVVRLALEMSTHEEQERRALEGELARLERAWREAEEIAGISDSLLLPSGMLDRLRSLRR
ncbi:MAG: hypothetical protein FIB01_04995 [Gemmatimonadetes bacterium]|nr:hypothetical protein [Gemmatimonadota bacterium]